jgi:cytochrome c551/c552
MVESGKKVFDQKCTACHRLGNRLVGPALGDITQKRSPEFIMNFLLNTQTMEARDADIKKLESQFGMQMPDPHVDKQQARDLLEYFRSVAPKSEKK